MIRHSGRSAVEARGHVTANRQRTGSLTLFAHLSFLMGIFVAISIVSIIGEPSANAAEVCHINLQGDEFDDIDEIDLDTGGINPSLVSQIFSNYENFCRPGGEEEGTVSQLSQHYSSQGFTSIFDLVEFEELGIPRDIFGGCDLLYHNLFDFEGVSGRGLVICPSIETLSLIISVTKITIGPNDSTVYTVQLRDRPSKSVRVRLLYIPHVLPGVPRPDVSWSPSVLEFTPNNWDIPQTVDVSSTDRFGGERGFNTEIGHYINGTQESAGSVEVYIEDKRGVALSSTALSIDEGGSGIYTVELESEPDGPVTITLNSSNGDVTVSPADLSFDEGNWDAPQTVTVSAAQDGDAIDDTDAISHAVNGYGDVADGGTVTVTVIDDDPVVEPGVRLSVSALSVDEGGSGTYTVVLESEPDGNVTVTPRSDDPGVTVSPADLSFDEGNWDAPQTVTVSAAQDGDAVDDTEAISHAVSGYGDVADGGTVTVTVIDDDPVVEPGVRLSVSALSVDEGGSGTYTVVLESEPDGNVTVTPRSDDPGVTVSPADLSFDEGNWDAPQTVTVSAAQDGDAVDDTEAISHAVSGYGDVADGGTVTVTVIDDDPVVEPGVRLSVSALSVDEGGSGTYTVVLESEPDGNVTVTPRSDDPGVTVSPADLSFDEGNWDAPQTVTVSAAQDGDAVDDTEAISHAVSGYGDVADGGTVTVTVIDDDPVVEPGVRLSVSALSVDEGGSGTYTVVLESEPDGNVTVTPRSDDPGVTVSPADLSFDEGNWSAPQTVTVSAVSDADATVEQVLITHSVTGYGDVTAADTLEITVNEVAPPVAPPVEEVERAAVTDTLATVAATTVANVTTNIGARFSAARSGTGLTRISLAGQSVTRPSTLEETDWNSLWEQDGYSRALSSDELLRSTDFQIALGANEGAQAQAAETWTFWGRGDLQNFSSQPSQGSSYGGDLRAGYFGLDTQVDDQWLAGVAVSRTMAEADYSLGISGADNDGTMDVSLTSLIPYVRFAPEAETELWAIVGVGQGEIENNRPSPYATTARGESSRTTISMGSAGVRHAMALGDPFDWALLGDVGFGQVRTEDGIEAIAGLTVDTWQARVGVEGSYTADLGDGGTITAFMEVAGRYDGGDEEEAGLELSPGMYIARPDTGFGLELRGRALVLHSAENYEEYGLSATASVTPRSDGSGLSLSLSPRWGEETGGTGTLWRDDSLGLLDSSSNDPNTMSLDTRLGYGIRTENGLLTPFSQFGLRDEGNLYWRVGTRFESGVIDPGALSLELSGEWRESSGSVTEHRIGLISRMRF